MFQALRADNLPITIRYRDSALTSGADFIPC